MTMLFLIWPWQVRLLDLLILALSFLCCKSLATYHALSHGRRHPPGISKTQGNDVRGTAASFKVLPEISDVCGTVEQDLLGTLETGTRQPGLSSAVLLTPSPGIDLEDRAFWGGQLSLSQGQHFDHIHQPAEKSDDREDPVSGNQHQGAHAKSFELLSALRKDASRDSTESALRDECHELEGSNPIPFKRPRCGRFEVTDGGTPLTSGQDTCNNYMSLIARNKLPRNIRPPHENLSDVQPGCSTLGKVQVGHERKNHFDPEFPMAISVLPRRKGVGPTMPNGAVPEKFDQENHHSEEPFASQQHVPKMSHQKKSGLKSPKELFPDKLISTNAYLTRLVLKNLIVQLMPSFFPFKEMNSIEQFIELIKSNSELGATNNFLFKLFWDRAESADVPYTRPFLELALGSFFRRYLNDYRPQEFSSGQGVSPYNESSRVFDLCVQAGIKRFNDRPFLLKIEQFFSGLHPPIKRKAQMINPKKQWVSRSSNQFISQAKRVTICVLYKIELIYRLATLGKEFKTSMESSLLTELENLKELWLRFPVLQQFEETHSLRLQPPNPFKLSKEFIEIANNRQDTGRLTCESRLQNILLSGWCLQKYPFMELIPDGKTGVPLRSFFVFLNDCSIVDLINMTV